MDPIGGAADRDPWFERVCRGSAMGDLVREFDWEATSLGHPSTWPPSLRNAAGLCLSSRFPMMLVWGSDLVMIYNDGYKDMLGSVKHPGALGAPASEVWTEIWDVIGPLFASVLETGEPTWVEDQRLVLERNGFPEETFFTYSYSPIEDEDGSVRGVLDIATETTQGVIARRELACLTDLAADLVSAELSSDAFALTVGVLSRHRADIVMADLFQMIGDEQVLVATNRRPGLVGWTTSTAGRPITPATVSERHDATRPMSRYVIDIGGEFGGLEAMLSLRLNPLRPFDDGYQRFVDLVAQIVSSAMGSAYKRTVEIGHHRRLTEALETALLQPASDDATVAARYLPADGSLAVGGDWYDVVDLGGDRRAIVVGDCVGHGVDAAAVMAQLRSVTRAMLIEGHGPAQALSTVDGLAETVDGALGATALIAIVDRRAGTITYSRAGHMPALVCCASSLMWLDGAGGPPLAVGVATPRADETVAYEHGNRLVMYSDGLIERSGENIDLGLERLARAGCDASSALTVQDAADQILNDLLPAELHDDVVLVVKHLVHTTAS